MQLTHFLFPAVAFDSAWMALHFLQFLAVVVLVLATATVAALVVMVVVTGVVRQQQEQLR